MLRKSQKQELSSEKKKTLAHIILTCHTFMLEIMKKNIYQDYINPQERSFQTQSLEKFNLLHSRSAKTLYEHGRQNASQKIRDHLKPEGINKKYLPMYFHGYYQYYYEKLSPFYKEANDASIIDAGKIKKFKEVFGLNASFDLASLLTQLESCDSDYQEAVKQGKQMYIDASNSLTQLENTPKTQANNQSRPQNTNTTTHSSISTALKLAQADKQKENGEVEEEEKEKVSERINKKRKSNPETATHEKSSSYKRIRRIPSSSSDEENETEEEEEENTLAQPVDNGSAVDLLLLADSIDEPQDRIDPIFAALDRAAEQQNNSSDLADASPELGATPLDFNHEFFTALIDGNFRYAKYLILSDRFTDIEHGISVIENYMHELILSKTQASSNKIRLKEQLNLLVKNPYGFRQKPEPEKIKVVANEFHLFKKSECGLESQVLQFNKVLKLLHKKSPAATTSASPHLGLGRAKE